MSKSAPDTDIAAMLRVAQEDKDADARRAWGERASSAVRAMPTKTFDALTRAAGLDPKRHHRLADWRGMDFSGCNLRGFDFTGARLWGAKFDAALIAAGPDRDGNPASAAVFDQAEWSAVDHNREPGSTEPGVLLAPVADLSTAADYSRYLAAWRPGNVPVRRAHLSTGAIFQDAPFAPEMVVVPTGTYFQGDETKPINGIDRREITIRHRLAVGRFPVTFEEWESFVEWDDLPDSKKLKRGAVVNISWNDIDTLYLPSLNKRLGLLGAYSYRLLSEAEWEFCCRAGTNTAFSFGDTIRRDQAQFSEKGYRDADQRIKVGSFPSNAWGLHDMHGTVWEWCQDLRGENYKNYPNDGTAMEDETKARTNFRILRGGSWAEAGQHHMCSKYRYGSRPDGRDDTIGFRLARTLSL